MTGETIHAGVVFDGGTVQVMTRLEHNEIAEHVRFPHSEVCMHLNVAGLIGHVQLVGDERMPMAQLLDLDFKPISFPVTTGEGGIHRDRDGFYAYTEAV